MELWHLVINNTTTPHREVRAPRIHQCLLAKNCITQNQLVIFIIVLNEQSNITSGRGGEGGGGVGEKEGGEVLNTEWLISC